MSTRLKYLLPMLVFLVISVFLYVGLSLNPKHLPSTLLDKPAPSFNAPLLYDSTKAFSPKDMLGQRWLMNIWASWCVSCRYEHPLLNELARKTSIPIIGLNYKDQPNDAKKWLLDRGDPYTLVPTDLPGDVGIEWGVYGVPETFVIDEFGVVVFKHAGPITADIVQKQILPLFSEGDNAE